MSESKLQLGYFEVGKERLDALAPPEGRLRLSFSSSGSFVPKDNGENSDTRSLSVKLSWLDPALQEKRPLVRLVRDDSVFDHAYACGFEDMAALVDQGYRTEGAMLDLPMASAPGLSPVYALVHPRTKDHSLALGDSGKKAAEDDGYRTRRVLGFARDSASAGYTPVYGIGINANEFFTVGGDEAASVVAESSSTYKGIAFWGMAFPGQDYAPLGAMRETDRGRSRALPDFARDAGLSGQAEADIFVSWWNSEGKPDFLGVLPAANVSGRKAMVVSTPGTMAADQTLTILYSGLSPNKPVRIRFSATVDLGAAQGACWLRVGAVRGRLQTAERVPALLWYDGEGRWDGRSSGGWKDFDFVATAADDLGRATFCVNLQNWSGESPQAASIAISGLIVETAPDSMPLRLKLEAPLLSPPSAWGQLNLRGAGLTVTLKPEWGDSPESAIRAAAGKLVFEVSDNGTPIPVGDGGRIDLLPGSHSLRAIAKAPGCIDSFLPPWTESRYLVGDFGDNILFNGDFSLGDSGWVHYAQDGDEASYSFDRGVVTIAVTKSGHPGEDWHTQLSPRVENMALEPKASYRLSFYASADTPRSLHVVLSEWGRDLNGNGQQWDNYISKLGNVNLTETETLYEETFVMNAQGDDKAYFSFKTGHETGTVRIRDARLVKVK